MNTINTVLMIILSAIIGFAAGNAWGKESMKRTFSDVIGRMTEGLKVAAGNMEKMKAMSDTEKKEE